MNTHDLQYEKINLINWITRLQDATVIAKLKKIQSNEDKALDLEDLELTKALDEAIESLDKEGGIPHEQVMSKMKSKYPNFYKA